MKRRLGPPLIFITLLCSALNCGNMYWIALYCNDTCGVVWWCCFVVVPSWGTVKIDCLSPPWPQVELPVSSRFLTVDNEGTILQKWKAYWGMTQQLVRIEHIRTENELSKLNITSA